MTRSTLPLSPIPLPLFLASVLRRHTGSVQIPFAIIRSIDAYLPRDFRRRRPIEPGDRAAGESLPEGWFFPPFKQQVRFVAAHTDIGDRTIAPGRIECVPHHRVAMSVVTDAAALPARDDQRIGRKTRVDVMPWSVVPFFDAVQC